MTSPFRQATLGSVIKPVLVALLVGLLVGWAASEFKTASGKFAKSKNLTPAACSGSARRRHMHLSDGIANPNDRHNYHHLQDGVQKQM